MSDYFLGINYSGYHDSSFSLIDDQGKPLFATSLERISRVKQDSRSIIDSICDLPWDKIKSVGVSSNNNSYQFMEPSKSKFHKYAFSDESRVSRQAFHHSKKFISEIQDIKCSDIQYFEHQLTHAASACFISGFDQCINITYDGGMPNSELFGSVSFFDNSDNLNMMDVFDSRVYPKISSLYTCITACCGLRPNRHEGKITGLAAFGRQSVALIDKLKQLYTTKYDLVESVALWVNQYSSQKTACFLTNQDVVIQTLDFLGNPSIEDLACNVQIFSEQLLDDIFYQVSRSSPAANLCLSGGLFANVRINQLSGKYFQDVIVAPPMTDDGTSLGAAYLARRKYIGDAYTRPKNKTYTMYLGQLPSETTIKSSIERAVNPVHQGLLDTKVKIMADELARHIDEGKIIAICRGPAEFGPRALGNRSIIASAKDPNINMRINNMLSRTEYMPFAPMCLDTDADSYFSDIPASCIPFMTSTARCSQEVIDNCSAVVHIDGTARPQAVASSTNPFIHYLLRRYKEISGTSIVINTSFNIHEEPIVNTKHDALVTAIIAGFDYLVLEDELINLKEIGPINYLSALLNLQYKSIKNRNNANDVTDFLRTQIYDSTKNLKEKQQEIQSYQVALDERNKLIDELTIECEKRLDIIKSLSSERDLTLVNGQQEIQSYQVALDERSKLIDELTIECEKRLDIIKSISSEKDDLLLVHNKKRTSPSYRNIYKRLIRSTKKNIKSILHHLTHIFKQI